MPALLRRIRRNILLKTVSDALTRGLTFIFSTLILARFLGASEFGVMSAAYTPALLVTILADPGIHLLVTREVASRRARGEGTIYQYVGNLLTVKLYLSVLVLVVLGAVSFTPPYRDLAVPLMLSGLFTVSWSLLEFTSSVLSGFERMEWEALLKGAGRIMMILLGGAALIRGGGVDGVLVGMMASPVVVLMGTTIVVHVRDRRWRPRWDMETIRGALRHALPLAAVSLISTLFVRVDVLLLQILRGNHLEIGIYSAAVRLIEALGGIALIFSSAIYPILSDLIHTRPDAFRALARDMLRLMAFLGLPICAVVLVLAPRIVSILGSEYTESATALRLLIGDIPFLFINMQLFGMMIAAGRQRGILVPSLLSLVVNVGLNMVLIPRIGYRGAAVATVLTDATLFVMISVMGRDLFPARFPFFLWRFVLAGAAAGGTLLPLDDLSPLLSLPVAAVVYLNVLWWTREVSTADIDLLRALAGPRLMTALTGGTRSR